MGTVMGYHTVIDRYAYRERATIVELEAEADDELTGDQHPSKKVATESKKSCEQFTKSPAKPTKIGNNFPC